MIGSNTKEKYPLLSKQEQINHWKQYQILINSLAQEGLSFSRKNIELYKSKNPNASSIIRSALISRERLILSNEGMIIQVANHYASKSSLPIEDLIQVGRESCIYALSKYNPYKNGRETKFSSYAMIWIRSKMLEAIKKTQQVNVPDYAKKDGYQQYKFVSHEHINGNYPEIYDRVKTEPDDDLLSVLTDKEIEILSHHFNLSGKKEHQNQVSLDLWGDGEKVQSIINKLKEAVTV